ncbi:MULTISPECIES: GNAT family N-acetyltransferase [unclassified Prochlorococcus]
MGRRLAIDNFTIKKQYRSQGLGSLLFDRLIEFAKEANCKTLSLQALSWNDIGLNLQIIQHAVC